MTRSRGSWEGEGSWGLLFSPLFLIETLAGTYCRCGEEGGSGPEDYIIGGGEVVKVLSFIKYLFFILPQTFSV